MKAILRTFHSELRFIDVLCEIADDHDWAQGPYQDTVPFSVGSNQTLFPVDRVGLNCISGYKTQRGACIPAAVITMLVRLKMEGTNAQLPVLGAIREFIHSPFSSEVEEQMEEVIEHCDDVATLHCELQKMCVRTSSENVKGVARRKEGGQSEAKEGRCPPLPLPSCSLLSSSEGEVSFVEALERKMYRDMGVPESLYPPQLFRGDPASDDKQPQS